MDYFELSDYVNFPHRWHLRGLIGFDGITFVRPPMVPVNDPLRDRGFDVKLQVNGTAMDYTTTSFRSVPITSFEVVRALSGLDGFSAFPASIRGFQQKTSYHILHFWDVVDCFDEAGSSFEVIPKDDPIRPDLAGNYRSVTRLRINPFRAGGKHIFRIARLEGRVIVSEEVKRRFEAAGVSGAVFDYVTPN